MVFERIEEAKSSSYLNNRLFSDYTDSTDRERWCRKKGEANPVRGTYNNERLFSMATLL